MGLFTCLNDPPPYKYFPVTARDRTFLDVKIFSSIAVFQNERDFLPSSIKTMSPTVICTPPILRLDL